MFENSKVALGFAGVTLLGTAIFAGMSERFSPSDDYDSVASMDTEAEMPPENPPAREQTQAAQPPVDFAEDEMLIDDATGFSPEPREVVELADPQEADSGDDSSGGASSDNPSGNDSGEQSSQSDNEGSSEEDSAGDY